MSLRVFPGSTRNLYNFYVPTPNASSLVSGRFCVVSITRYSYVQKCFIASVKLIRGWKCPCMALMLSHHNQTEEITHALC
jgi:hypothetical protein